MNKKYFLSALVLWSSMHAMQTPPQSPRAARQQQPPNIKAAHKAAKRRNQEMSPSGDEPTVSPAVTRVKTVLFPDTPAGGPE